VAAAREDLRRLEGVQRETSSHRSPSNSLPATD
jgi:hypothetical protein